MSCEGTEASEKVTLTTTQGIQNPARLKLWTASTEHEAGNITEMEAAILIM